MRSTCLLTAISAACLLSGCANSLFVGHKHGIDLETEVKSDMSAPISFNFGYQSHSAIAVPPRKSLSPSDLPKTSQLAEGELLSTYSVFKLQRNVGSVTDPVTGNTTSINQPGAFTIRTGLATGSAATNISKQVSEGRARTRGPAAAPQSATFGRMKSILTN
jgi:hypothetical protein